MKTANKIRLYSSVILNLAMTVYDGFVGSKLLMISNIASMVSDLSEPQVLLREPISTDWRIPSLIVREMIDLAFVILSPDKTHIVFCYLLRFVFPFAFGSVFPIYSTFHLFVLNSVARFCMKYL